MNGATSASRQGGLVAACASIVVMVVSSLLIVRMGYSGLSKTEGGDFFVLFAASTLVALLGKFGTDAVTMRLVATDAMDLRLRLGQAGRVHFSVGFLTAVVVYVTVLAASGSAIWSTPAVCLFLFGLVEGRCAVVADVMRGVGRPWESFFYYYGGFRVVAYGLPWLLSEMLSPSLSSLSLVMAVLASTMWIMTEVRTSAGSPPSGFEFREWVTAGWWFLSGGVLYSGLASALVIVSAHGASSDSKLRVGMLGKLAAFALLPAVLANMLLTPAIRSFGEPPTLKQLRALTRPLVIISALTVASSWIGFGAARRALSSVSSGGFSLSRGEGLLLTVYGVISMLAVPVTTGVHLYAPAKYSPMVAAVSVVSGVGAAVVSPVSPSVGLCLGLIVAALTRFVLTYVISGLPERLARH